MREPARSAGRRGRSRTSAPAASTSTRRRRSPTGACSPRTPTGRSTPSAPPPAICSGRATSARTSTRPPAVWDKKVYVGTYDGKFLALDAATGDTRWSREMPSAVHGAPTVMSGLVYFSTCGFCGHAGSRYAKNGRERHLRARTPAPGSSSGRSRTASTRRSSQTESGSTSRARRASTGSQERSDSAEASRKATAIPVSGQIRYDVWKTRAMKSRTKIETAKPAAASQSRPERRTAQSEPRRHRQPDEQRRAARTGRRRSGRRSRPR